MPAARQGGVKEEAQALSVCSGHKYDLLAMRWEAMGFPATRVAISVAPWPFRTPAGRQWRAGTSLEPRLVRLRLRLRPNDDCGARM